MDPKETEGVLQLEWAAISAAPFSFIAALAVISGAIFPLTRSFYKQQIVTLTARHELARDQAEDAQEKKKGLEARIDSLQAEIRGFTEAVEQDAADRKQPVSPVVAEAASATEGAMERLKEEESDFSATVDEILAARFAAWDDKFVLTKEDVLSADELNRLDDRDKDKD